MASCVTLGKQCEKIIVWISLGLCYRTVQESFRKSYHCFKDFVIIAEYNFLYKHALKRADTTNVP